MTDENHYLQRLNLLIRKFKGDSDELTRREYQEIITLLIKAFRENMKDGTKVMFSMLNEEEKMTTLLKFMGALGKGKILPTSEERKNMYEKLRNLIEKHNSGVWKEFYLLINEV